MLCISCRRPANCGCVVHGGLIKERNSELPVYVGSSTTNVARLSQPLLRNTYPVLADALQRSGNRFINPVRRISPRFASIKEYATAQQAMDLMMSTFEPRCQYPPCPEFLDPVLESWRKELEGLLHSGDPVAFDTALENYLSLMDSFAALISLGDPEGEMNFTGSQLYPHRQQRNIGLRPRIDLLIREAALQIIPLVAQGGPDKVYDHLSILHRMTGKDTMIVRRLIEDLRDEERRDLHDYVLPLYFSGDILSWKIMQILSDERVDDTSFRQWYHTLGGV